MALVVMVVAAFSTRLGPYHMTRHLNSKASADSKVANQPQIFHTCVTYPFRD
jgi:hypothetical protein